MDRFDWNSDGSVIVKAQDAIAVYVIVDGHVVIRQRNAAFFDDIVVIAPADARKLCEAILIAADTGVAG